MEFDYKMLVGNYDAALVACSILIAVLASYTALSMAERMHAAEKTAWWHVAGAIAMGVGIWSMHFIGMLAFRLPIELGYDLGLTFLSLVIAIVVSYFALWQASIHNTTKRQIFASAILMGLGISAMHYTGMEAMRMFPAIEYQTDLFILSVIIAILASYAALHIFLWLRIRTTKYIHTSQLLAAIVMGLAIVGMHYTGMMAAQFPEGSICRAADMGIQTQTLAILVGLGSLIVLLVSKVASIFDTKTAYFIQSLEAANEQLKTQAFYDPLTKLPNRILLEERVRQALQRAKDQKHFVAYMVINLDGFKTINDSLGHSVGDVYLIGVADRIRLLVDDQYTVARATGDEFVVVLERIAPEDAAIVAEKIISSIKQPIFINGKELVTSASIGIAVSLISGNTYEDLAFHANSALQHTKRSGKNGYRYYEETMDGDASFNLELISELRHARELDQLSLYYQPKFDVKTGCVYGAEALLRWEHPQHGFVSPAKFIPLAEESGLIVSIGEWVLDQACRQIQEWRALGYQEMNVSVNISLVQFLQESFYQKLVALIKHRDIPASTLTLEITETTAMQDVEHSLEVMRKISDLGVRISIDDFGTGYSSLLYLKRFPANELKIDRGFIQAVCTDSEDALLVSAICILAHQFGLKVVAEGVETEQQKDMLDTLECDILQGFFLGKPKPSVEFFFENREYMKKNRVDGADAESASLRLSLDG